jgi:hypothetical protein
MGVLDAKHGEASIWRVVQDLSPKASPPPRTVGALRPNGGPAFALPEMLSSERIQEPIKPLFAFQSAAWVALIRIDNICVYYTKKER